MHPSRAAAKVAQAQEEQSAAVRALVERFDAFEDKLDMLIEAVAQVIDALKPADKPAAKK